MRWFFVTVRDDEGKVIGYFERHEMHWDFSDPGKACCGAEAGSRILRQNKRRTGCENSVRR